MFAKIRKDLACAVMGLVSAAPSLPSLASASLAVAGGATLAACGGGSTKEVGQLPDDNAVTGEELLADLQLEDIQMRAVGVKDLTSPAPDYRIVLDLVARNGNPEVGDHQLKDIATLASEISGHQVRLASAEMRVQAINSNGEIVIEPGLTDVDGNFEPIMFRPYQGPGGVDGANPGAFEFNRADIDYLAALTSQNIIGLSIAASGTIVASASTEATTDFDLDQDVLLPLKVLQNNQWVISTKVEGDLTPNKTKDPNDIDNNGKLFLKPHRNAAGQLTDGKQDVDDNTVDGDGK